MRVPWSMIGRLNTGTLKLPHDWLSYPQVKQVFQQTGFKRVKRGYKPLRVENLVPRDKIRPQSEPTDPYFPFQWYLKNTGQNGGKAKLDLNVEAAWAQGITGKNVTTAIMDDGELHLTLFHLILNINLTVVGIDFI